MAAALSTNTSGPFVLTRTKIFLIISVALTWWLAHIFPHYEPLLKAQFRSRLEEARQKIPSVKVDWHRELDPRASYNQSKLALLIEPRPIPHLVPQLLHMISVVPPDWRFMFIGTEKSVLSLGRSFALKHQQVSGKLDLLVLPEPWEIDEKEYVYRLLTDTRFYDEFLPGVEWILKFESDSIMCANAKTSLNDWLDWSWAGAPKSADDRFAGNGGLSLRRVSAIKRILGFQARYNDSEPEDEWYGKRLWVLPGEKVASGLSGVLAVENVYIENAVGYHVTNGGKALPESVWKDHNRRKKIFEYCPELSLIMDMKLERERCEGDDKEGNIPPPEEDPEETKKKLEEAQKLEDERKKEAQKLQEAAKEEALKSKAEKEAAEKEAAEGGGEKHEGGDAEDSHDHDSHDDHPADGEEKGHDGEHKAEGEAKGDEKEHHDEGEGKGDDKNEHHAEGEGKGDDEKGSGDEKKESHGESHESEGPANKEDEKSHSDDEQRPKDGDGSHDKEEKSGEGESHDDGEKSKEDKPQDKEDGPKDDEEKSHDGEGSKPPESSDGERDAHEHTS